jgi:nucleoid-associated protein YgaU
MSTETRIGIVTGLLIVVIASVYFFYSGDAEEAEFLVSTGPKVTAPLEIPSSSDEQAAPTLPTSHQKAASHRPSAARQTSSTQTRRSKPAGGDRIVRSDGRRPLRVAPVTRSRDARTQQWRRNSPSPGRTTPPTREPSTSLRTGPAPELIEATRDNIARTNNSPAKPAAQRPTPGERLRARGQPAGGSDIAGRRSPLPTGSLDTTSVSRPRGSTAGPTANRQPLPAASWPKRHKIAAGETLSDIALRYYDRSRSFDLILQANPQIKNPRELRIGDIITIPGPTGAAATTPSGRRSAPRIARRPEARPDSQDRSRPRASSDRTYRVREGDTFYLIAAAQCGSSGRWQEVYQLNRDLVNDDPKKLKPGMVLRLP